MDSHDAAFRSELEQKVSRLEAELDRIKNSKSSLLTPEIGTITWHVNKDIIHLDDEARTITGLNKSGNEISKDTFFKQIPDSQRDEIIKEFNEIMEAENSFSLEYVFSPPGRSTFRLRHWGKVIQSNGSDVMLTGAIMKVNTETSNSVEFTDNYSLFEKFFEKNLAGIYILQNDNFEYVNNRLTEITGYSKQQLQEEIYLNEIIHSADKKIVEEHIEQLQSGKLNNLEYSYRLIHKEGRVKYVDVDAVPITYKNQPAIIGSVIDNTPHKLREKQLREATQKYKILAEQELYGIYILIDDEIVYLNKKAANILGYEPDELTGISLLKADILTDKELFLQNLRKRKEDPTATFNFETKAKTSSGEIIDIEISSAPIRFNSQIAMLGVIKNITEKKQARKKLEASESRNRAIISALPDMLVHLNKKGEYLNMHIPTHFDTAVEEKKTIGKTLHEAVSEDVATLFTKNIAKSINQKKLITFEYKIEGTEEIRFREARMTPLDEDSVLVIVRDVTERKKAESKLRQNEKRLRMLLDQLPAILWTTDPHLNFTSSQGSGLKSLGLSPGELVGTSLFDFFETEDKSYLPIKKHYEALAGHSVRYNFEWDNRIYKVKIDPLQDNKGHIMGTVAMATDITQQEHAKTELEQSLQEKEILLAEIHHRVKNNLSLINSIFELQLFHIENEEVLKILRQNKNRVMTIAAIHKLLYEADNLSMVKLDKYVQILCSHYNKSDFNTHISAQVSPVNLSITQAIPLGLILDELIANALKHAKSSNIVEISIAKDNNKICMQVKDSGPGLPPDMEWHDYNTLGMTLIKRLTMQLEAEFTYTYNKGSVFTLKFDKTDSENQVKTEL